MFNRGRTHDGQGTSAVAPGKSRKVTFTLDKSDFGFHDNSGRYVVEPGQIDVYAGNSSKADLKQSFQVTG